VLGKLRREGTWTCRANSYGEIERHEARLRNAAREGNWRGALAALGILLEARASLFGPGAAGGMTQIERPMAAREPALVALFVGDGEIEMDVGVPGNHASGAAEMNDSQVDLALLLINTAEIVLRDAAIGIKADGGEKFGACFLGLAHLIERDAEIDVRLDPVGCEMQRLAIELDGLGDGFFVRFAIHSGLEEFLRGAAGEGVDFLGGRIARGAEREGPLLLERAERTSGAGRHDQDVAALFDEAQLLKRKRLRAKLIFDELDRAVHAQRGNAIVGEALDRAQSDEVAKGVEALTPSRAWADEMQAFPISQTARLDSYNSSYFSSRVSLRQS
jgi:hypothetical protein